MTDPCKEAKGITLVKGGKQEVTGPQGTLLPLSHPNEMKEQHN